MGKVADQIKEHEWPWPQNWMPGFQYLYVPATDITAAKEEGWVYAGEEHAFQGTDYMLMRKGRPMRFVKPHQTVPDISVWISCDEEETEAYEPVSSEMKTDKSKRVRKAKMNDLSVSE